jgi:hypothetical protein
MSRLEKKKKFIHELAVFLVGNEATKSVCLEIELGRKDDRLPKWAHEWSNLRSSTPLSGWMSIEEAEVVLNEFLG